MNIREFLIPFVLATTTVFVFQRFFMGTSDPQATRYHVPPKTDMQRPLQFEVDFFDESLEGKEVTTAVHTDYGSMTFSSFGAAMQEVRFSHEVSGKTIWIPGLQADGREDRNFLVALEQKTPYVYELVEHQEDDEQVTLHYKTKLFAGGELHKQFVVHKHKPKIDLTLSLQGISKQEEKKQEPYRLRLLYSSPSMLHKQEGTIKIEQDTTQCIFSEREKLKQETFAKAQDDCWELPSYFGGGDRYFVQVLVEDKQQFAQRGYFGGTNEATGVRIFLEGPQVADNTNWKLSFYFGPKLAPAFDRVDPKLDDLLSYGFFAFLAKLLLAILNFFYGYVKNYGLAIILLTLLIKIVSLPVSLRGDKSTKNMQKLAQKMEHIKRKYRNNPELLQQAQTELMQKEGVSSMGGCLVPILIQIPVFIALRSALGNAFELFKAPFLWVPDLSAPDPYYLLPLGVMLCMLMQMMTAGPFDPKKGMNSLAMSIFLGAAMSLLPAGVVLYVFSNTGFSVIQSRLYNWFAKGA